MLETVRGTATHQHQPGLTTGLPGHIYAILILHRVTGTTTRALPWAVVLCNILQMTRKALTADHLSMPPASSASQVPHSREDTNSLKPKGLLDEKQDCSQLQLCLISPWQHKAAVKNFMWLLFSEVPGTHSAPHGCQKSFLEE